MLETRGRVDVQNIVLCGVIMGGVLVYASHTEIMKSSGRAEDMPWSPSEAPRSRSMTREDSRSLAVVF